ncbi:hypothetical protein [Nocardia sp. No.11]|uniref:hypothetical protein n=1 Tax=Nocardia sp. No.11 TaxID=3128861 RepID=UPI00319DC17A
MSLRLATIIDAVQRDYHNNPDLESEAARHDRVRTLTQLRDRLAAEAFETRAPERGQSSAEIVASVQADLSEAEDEIIRTEIIGRLPTRAFHDYFTRQAGLLLEGEVAVMPESVHGGYKSAQHWRERLAELGIEREVRLRGEEPYYDGINPIEDVAYPPRIEWSATDHAAALERVVAQYALEPGQWIELEWPPQAYLWSEGHSYRTTFEACETHSDENDGDETIESELEECGDCTQSEWVIEKPATWNFTAMMTVREVVFDHSGEQQFDEVERTSVDVFQYSELDPAQIVIGPYHGN